MKEIATSLTPERHYSAFRYLDTAKLRRVYEALLATPVAELTTTAPLTTAHP